MVSHAVLLDLFYHFLGHRFVNIHFDKELLWVLAVVIDLVLKLPYFISRSLYYKLHLIIRMLIFIIVVVTLLFLSRIFIFLFRDSLVFCSHPDIVIIHFKLLISSLQLSQWGILESAVLLEPGLGVEACPPDVILVSILDATLVSNDYMLVSEYLFDSLLTLKVVLLNLKVLVTIKVHEIVRLVSPICIVMITFFDLVRPPSYYLSLLLLIE